MRHRLLALVTILAIAIASAAAPARSSALHTTVTDGARARAATGDVAGAIAELRAFVAGNPGDAAAERVLGDLYFRAALPRQAEAAWKRVLTIDPDDAVVRTRLGAMYAAQDRVPAAIAQFALLEPSQATIGALVRLHARAHDLTRFLNDAASDAALHRFDATAQWREANVLQFVHRSRDALPFYASVVDLRGSHCDALLGRAGDLLALRRLDDARADAQRCLQLEPMSSEALVTLATIEIASGDLATARGWIDRAVAIDPGGVDALIDRAYLEDAAGVWQAAMRDNRSAIALDPTRYEGYANVAYDLLDQRRPAAAELAIRDGLRADPRNGRLHFLLARAYELEGRPAIAVRGEYAAALTSDEDVVVQAANEALRTLTTKHDPMTEER